MKTKLLFAVSTAIVLTGCVLGPAHQVPAIDVDDAWHTTERAESAVTTSAPVQTEWWQAIGDSVLTGLVKKAAIHNLDLRLAEASIREARALRRAQAAGYYPDINVGAAARREGLSENAGMPTGAGFGIPVDRDYYEAGFDASWEPDVFGRVRRSVEAADARLVASVENRADILMSVMAEVARSYIELRGAQRRMTITEENIELQRKTVTIVRQRHDAGDASNFELTRAEAQLRVTEATLPNLTADIRASAHRVAVLTGQEPQTLFDSLLAQEPLPAPPDIVPVGLRSDILRRRPDVRQAERVLAAETADIGVATAELFPRFFLTGGAAQQALSFGDLFDASSTAWSLGALMQWPVFRGGEIRARIDAEAVQAEAAALRYEKTVLVALEDAETALARYGQELETRRRLEHAVASNERAVRLARQRYELGEDNILAVVDAERELNLVANDLVRSETRTVTHLVSLYKALGGGWEVFEYDG